MNVQKKSQYVQKELQYTQHYTKTGNRGKQLTKMSKIMGYLDNCILT